MSRPAVDREGRPPRPEAERAGAPMRILLVGTARSMHTEALEIAGRASCFIRRGSVKPYDLKPAYDRLVIFDDGTPEEEWIATARVLHEAEPYGAVCCFYDEEMPLAGAIAGALGIYSTIRPEVVAATIDKLATREVVRRAGLDPTKSGLVATGDEIRAFGSEHGYPIVLKPRDGSGSAGVSLIAHPREIDAAIQKLADGETGLPAVVESYIEGEVYGIDALSEDGSHRVLSIAGVIKDEDARFVGQGHIVPAPLAPSVAAEVGRFVADVLTALGVTDGPSHSEIILTAAGPKLLETHMRIGGDHMPKLLKLTLGVDVPRLVARQSLGERVFGELPERLGNGTYAAIWYQSPTRAGVLRGVEGLEEASAMEGVRHVHVGGRVGEPIHTVQKATDRPACAIAGGASADEALARARRAAEAIRLDVEPVPA